MIRRLLVPALVVLAFAAPVAAGEPTDRLRRLFEQANRILLASDNDSPLDDRLAAIHTLVNDAFDAREAAALALGREWHVRTAVEREELVQLYADLVERAYLAGIGSRARVHGDGVRMAFDAESIQGDRAAVMTTLQTRGGGEMPIEYRMGRRDGRWTVHDVVIDGLSLAESYRVQFQRVMHGGTYADLVARLRDKASNATLIAIARARTARTARAVAPPGSPPPIRTASVASASDAPPVESRTAAPAPTASVAISSPVTPIPAPVSVVAQPTAPTPAPVSAVAPPTAPMQSRLSGVVPPGPPVAPLPTPAPPARRATVETPAAARQSFWIQVGAFRDTEAASRLVERLRRHSVTIAPTKQRSSPLARVLVGPFTNRAAAASALRELAASGYRAFIALE
jgi:ABC-type transporter MlaC component/cell division septation protein DedD